MPLTKWIVLGAVLALAACETVEGFGRDVETGGEAIQDASEDTQARL